MNAIRRCAGSKPPPASRKEDYGRIGRPSHRGNGDATRQPFGITFSETDRANDEATRWLELLGRNWQDTGHRWTSTAASFASSALCLTRLAENRNGTARLTEKGRGLAGGVVRIIQDEAGCLVVTARSS